MKCDFCSSPLPEWRYPAHSFRVYNHAESEGDWLACKYCHWLIQTNRRDELTDHALAAISRKHGIPASFLGGAVRQHTLAMHAKFFAAKCGEPRKIRSSL